MSDWTECQPNGPQKAGEVGGDHQVTEAYSRRWWRRHPDGERYLVIEFTTYGVLMKGRRWMETEVVHEIFRSDFEPHGPFDDPEWESTDIQTSYEDGPEGEGWPTKHDVYREVARIREPHDWDGDIRCH
jgi:hypothetical protein